MAAVPTLLVEMAKLIYSVPENQPWYTLDGGVLLTQKASGWVLKTSRGEVVQIGRMVFSQMSAKLSHRDKNDDSDCYNTIMQYVLGGHTERPYSHTTILAYV